MENEILQGIRLIGVFDGIPEKDIFIGSDNETLWANNLHPKGIAPHGIKLDYYSSWDWLMPVFEKINTIENGIFRFKIYQNAGLIESNEVDFTLPGQPHRYHIGATATTTIEAVWLTCIAFITWYNNNNTNNKS